MRKDISPEMYNYNKYPGPQFVTFEDQVKSEGIQLTICQQTPDAFDATAFSQRFSDILLKYDYIVGDWGNDQLRLRGFYKDEPTKPLYGRISRLDDYLKEYCNFGCAYFVLENPNPIALVSEEEPSRPRRRRERRRSRSKGGDKAQAVSEPRNQALDKPSFTKTQKPRPKRDLKSQRTNKMVGDSPDSGKTNHFTIRQKG